MLDLSAADLLATSTPIRTENPTVLPVKFYDNDFNTLLYEGELHWNPDKPTEPPTFSLINGDEVVQPEDETKHDDDDIKHTHRVISTLGVPLGFSCSPSELEGAVLPWFCKEMAQIRRNNKEWPHCSEAGCGLPLKVQIWMWEGAPRIVLACEKCLLCAEPGHLGEELIQTFLSERGLI